MLHLLIALCFCGTMIYAIVSDLFTMTIRNNACLLLAAGFFILAPLNGLSWQATGWHTVAGFIALAICFGLFLLRAMGGGDAKLISATVLWTGFSPALADYLLISAIAGGVLTLLILLLRKLCDRSKLEKISFLYRLSAPTEGIPYGIALGIAGLLIYPKLPMLS